MDLRLVPLTAQRFPWAPVSTLSTSAVPRPWSFGRDAPRRCRRCGRRLWKTLISGFLGEQADRHDVQEPEQAFYAVQVG